MKCQALAVLGLLMVIPPAAAQSTAEFVKAFSGQWQVYDPQLSSGSGLCQATLSGTATANRMPVDTVGCATPVSEIVAWSIEGNQLVFYDRQEAVVVRLGGNQKRITGTTESGAPVILERNGGDGTAAKLQAAYNASGCYYLGYSQTCAARTELGLPRPMPDGTIRIQMQVNLNARTEPRSDAESVGTVQQSTCVVVDKCIMASDGPWCRAAFGTAQGWLRKMTLRQNRWPVATFTNSCTP